MAGWRVTELAEATRTGVTEPSTAASIAVDRAAEADGSVWIHRCDGDAVMEAATRVAEHPDRHTLPLCGVPFAVKDNIDVAGIPTTAACPDFAYTPHRSAAVVERLQAAGAILIGKTNMDQFATGLVGTRSPYGTPANPLHPAHLPGGSSSGSAVAVASGQVAFALGTDTAGSGRVPAAFCEIVGYKPTVGRIPIRGVVPACLRLDCISIFTSRSSDAAAVVAACEGYDIDSPFSRRAPDRQPLAAGHTPRVGVATGASLTFLSDAAERAWMQIPELLSGAGCEIEPVDIAALVAVSELLYGSSLAAERLASHGEFIATHADSLHPVTREVFRRAAGWPGPKVFSDLYRLDTFRRSTQAIWADLDAVVVPTVHGHPSLAEVETDPLGVNIALGRYTNFVNLLDLCALAIPGVRGADDLPMGISLIAPAWHDAVLEDLAARINGGDAHRVPQGHVALAVVGAHLSGQPLNAQLTDRGARLLSTTRTAARYQLFSLSGGPPARPGLKRVKNGAEIEVEVWALSPADFGSFVAQIPPPLGIGSVELVNGEWVRGFICEPHGLQSAEDITSYGGWRNFVSR